MVETTSGAMTSEAQPTEGVVEITASGKPPKPAPAESGPVSGTVSLDDLLTRAAPAPATPQPSTTGAPTAAPAPASVDDLLTHAKDQPKDPPPPALQPGQISGMVANIGAGASTASAALLGAPVDLMTAALKLGARGVNKATGYEIFPDPHDPFMGSDWWKKAFGYIHADPNTVVPTTAAERYSRAISTVVSAAVLPGGVAKLMQRAATPGAAETLWTAGRDILAQGASKLGIGTSAVQGAGGQGMRDLVTTLGAPQYGDLADMGTQIVLGLATPFASTVASKGWNVTKEAILEGTGGLGQKPQPIIDPETGQPFTRTAGRDPETGQPLATDPLMASPWVQSQAARDLARRRGGGGTVNVPTSDQAPGTVRLYSVAGETAGIPAGKHTWVTADPNQAQTWAAYEPDGRVYFVDVPESHSLLDANLGPDGRVQPFTVPPHISQRMTPLDQSLPPNTRLSVGQITEDPRQLILERELRNDPTGYGRAAFNIQDSNNQLARAQALDNIAPAEAGQAAAEHIRALHGALRDQEVAETAAAQAKARQAADNLGGRGVTAQGEGGRMRGDLEGIRVPIQRQLSREYDAIDPKGELTLNTSDVASTATAIRAKTGGPGGAKVGVGGALSADEERVISAAEGLTGVNKFADLRSLRGNVSEVMRDMRRQGITEDSIPYARMKRLRGAIERSIEEATERAVTGDTSGADYVRRFSPTPIDPPPNHAAFAKEAAANYADPDAHHALNLAASPNEFSTSKALDGINWARANNRPDVAATIVANHRALVAEAAAHGAPYAKGLQQQLDKIEAAYASQRPGGPDQAGGVGAAGPAAAEPVAGAGAAPAPDTGTVVAGVGTPGGRAVPAGDSPVAAETSAVLENFDPASAAAIRDLNARYQDMKQTFREGAVGEVLAPGRSGYRLGDASVPQRVMRPGPQGADAADQLIKAAQAGGVDPVKVLGEYPALAYRNAVMRDGTVDMAAHAKFLRDYAPFFDKFPELRAKFENVADAQQAAIDAVRSGKAKVQAFEDSAASHYLNNDDPARAMKNLLASPTAATEASQLMTTVGDNAAAVQGIRRNLVEHLMATFDAGPAGFKKILADPLKARAIRTILGDDGLERVQSVVNSLEKQKLSVTGAAIPGSPTTAADLGAAARAANQGDGLAKLILMEHFFGLAGRVVGHVVGAAGVGEEIGRNLGLWFSRWGKVRGQMGIDNMRQLQVEAVLNPRLYNVLQQKYPLIPNSPIFRDMIRAQILAAGRAPQISGVIPDYIRGKDKQ